MAYQLAFVNSIVTSPTIRLNLNDGVTISTLADGADFGLPSLDRAYADTLLADGAVVPAAAYGNRMITLPLEFPSTLSADAAAAAWQSVVRELDRPANFLRYTPDTTNPVFFRCLRSDASMWDFNPITRRATVRILAEPFGYGPLVTLPAVTVYNDPAEGQTLSLNPFFETDASDWIVTGGTFARSTLQAHEGSASGLLTPDGVSATALIRSSQCPVATGQSVRVSAWVRCAVARIVRLEINWFDSSHATISTGNLVTGPSLAATTWTLLDGALTAPASAAYAELRISMTGTPPGSNTLHVDEARLRVSGDAGGQCFDVTGVQGDVETPLMLSIPASGLFPGGSSTTGRTSCIAVRRRGTPSAAPFVLQAESLTLAVDTTLPGADALMSGSGSNYARVSFATATTLTQRMFTSAAAWAAASKDIRGMYRVFARTRHSVAGDTIQLMLKYYFNGGSATNSAVTLSGSANIRYADLGLIAFPTGAAPATDGYSGVELSVSTAQIEIRAARPSGSGNVDIDFLIFVPADDRLALVTWGLTGGPDTFVLDSSIPAAYATAAGAVYNDPPFTIVGGVPMVSPSATNRIYFINNVNSTDAATDGKTLTNAITPSYYPRYLAVRPLAS